jgi:hypothetical protein
VVYPHLTEGKGTVYFLDSGKPRFQINLSLYEIVSLLKEGRHKGILITEVAAVTYH